MIGVIFQFASQIVEVRIKGSNVFFRTPNSQQFGDINGIKLDKVGTIKEFPDLKDKEDWQRIARDRFKEKIKNMKTEKERAQYVIDDLTKFGYKPIYLQKEGYRPIKIS